MLSLFTSISESVDRLILIKKESVKNYLFTLINKKIDNHEKKFKEWGSNEFGPKLKNYLDNLNKLSWVAEYSKSKYTELKNEIQGSIKKHTSNILESLTVLSLNIDYSSNIEEYSSFYSSLIQMSHFEYFDPEIKEKIERAESLVSEKLFKILEEVCFYLEIIEDKSFNIVKLERQLLFLENLCKSQLPLKKNALKVIEKADVRLNDYFFNKKQTINGNMKLLENRVVTNDEEEQIIVNDIYIGLKEIKNIQISKFLNLLQMLSASFNDNIIIIFLILFS